MAHYVCIIVIIIIGSIASRWLQKQSEWVKIGRQASLTMHIQASCPLDEAKETCSEDHFISLHNFLLLPTLFLPSNNFTLCPWTKTRLLFYFYTEISLNKEPVLFLGVITQVSSNLGSCGLRVSNISSQYSEL